MRWANDLVDLIFYNLALFFKKNDVWILNDLNINFGPFTRRYRHRDNRFNIIVYSGDLPDALDFLCCIGTYVTVARRYRS